MPKKQQFLIKDKSKFDAQGRGCGRDDNYNPAFKIREVRSKAQRQRVFILRFNRIYEMMSHGETLTLLQLDWNDNVREVREQFPLDPEITMAIAEKLNLKHPGYTRGGTIMTSDFFVTYKKPVEGSTQYVYQIKFSKDDLDDKRTLAKLQIEEEYWKTKNIPWNVVFSNDYNKIYCDNLQLLQPFRNCRYTDKDLMLLFTVMCKFIEKNKDLKLSNLPNDKIYFSNTNLNIDLHEALKILLAKKFFYFPIETTELINCYLKEIEVNK